MARQGIKGSGDCSKGGRKERSSLGLWALLALCCSFFTFLFAFQGQALAASELSNKTERSVRGTLEQVLRQYCPESCQLLRVEAETAEEIIAGDELGFESGQSEQQRQFELTRISLDVQIDERLSADNRQRIKRLIELRLADYGVPLDLRFELVTLPQIGQGSSLRSRLLEQVKQRVERAAGEVFSRYCPERCVLSAVSVDADLVNFDAVSGRDSRDFIAAEAHNAALLFKRIAVETTLDSSLAQLERERIVSLLQAKLQFYRPVEVLADSTAFPESFAQRSAREQAAAEDPFGLRKLRETLEIFKELAGTKEIITSTQSSSTENSESATLNSNSSNSSETSSSSSQSESEKASESALITEANLPYWIGGGVLALLLLIFLMLRFQQARSDAKIMMESANRDAAGKGDGKGAAATAAGTSKIGIEGVADDGQLAKAVRDKLTRDSLKSELTEIFVQNPKVAKDTVSRMLQDEGVEETSKYVSIFGKLVVFELLSDPNQQRQLYELSEYYHKSKFELSLEDEIQLMQTLKNKVTASEIKILAKRSIDQFDFLQRLDPSQIYELMSDEKPQIQSIILTQMGPRKRKVVFELFEGKAKLQLMTELCRADSIPRDFLYNVAIALNKKVSSKPEFDTQSLRSSEIILELLEKASLEEQKQIMRNLNASNLDTAKAVKLKLVTIETLGFLKDGHLLEIVLGMEHEDLLNFLAGCPGHIRRLLLAHAPRELAESWQEELESMSSVDETIYSLVELKVLGKIRQLAASGACNLLEINELIFAGTENPDEAIEPAALGSNARSLVA